MTGTSQPYEPQHIAVASHVMCQHPVLRAEILEVYPDARFNDSGARLTGRDLAAFLDGADAAIIAREIVDADLLDALPALRVIGKYGVGLDTIDLEAMSARGVRLGWKGGVNAQAVAELALGLILACLRAIPQSDADMRHGRWKPFRGRLLVNQTIGLVGCGHIGQVLGRMLRALGCRVLAHDIRALADFHVQYGTEPVSLETLVREADVVSLHLPETPATRGIVDRELLAALRPGAILINTARAGIVDNRALADALKDGRLAAAAFDVFDPEPPVDRSLFELSNFIATPHIGGSSVETVLECGRSAIAGLRDAKDPYECVPDWAR